MAQTARSLPDMSAAAIHKNDAVEARIERTSAILREDPEEPCVDLIAVCAIDKDKAWVKALVEAYPSPEVKECVLERIKGSVRPGW